MVISKYSVFSLYVLGGNGSSILILWGGLQGKNYNDQLLGGAGLTEKL